MHRQLSEILSELYAKAKKIPGEIGMPASPSRVQTSAISAPILCSTAQLAALRILAGNPNSFKRAADTWYDITVDEFSKLDSGLRDGIVINKDYNSCSAEVNYERTPRRFDGREVPEHAVRRVFEAARWAPSSFNEQPYRFTVG